MTEKEQEQEHSNNIDKLERDIFSCRAEILKLPVYQRNRPLCKVVVTEVLPLWARCFSTSSPNTWNKIWKQLPKELNETEPAIVYILNQVQQTQSNEDEQTLCFTIVDICSGFGLASMLLSELLHISSTTNVKEIWLLDKLWPARNAPPSSQHRLSTAHISSSLRQWPIPLRIRKMDIKRKREQAQLPKYVYGNTRIIFMGIHLCKKLAVHAINMFTTCETSFSLVLKPCCLPGGKQLYCRNEQHEKEPISYEFENGYSFCPLELYQNNDECGKSEFDEHESNDKNVEVEQQAADAHNDNDDDHAHDSSQGGTTNARFSSWVQHLECGCKSDSCRVRRETTLIQPYHFQNEFLYCERIFSSL